MKESKGQSVGLKNISTHVIVKHVLECLDDKDIAKLISVDRYSATLINSWFIQARDFLKSPDLKAVLTKMHRQSLIKDYKVFYQTLLRIPKGLMQHLQYDWQLMCLTGDPTTIERSIREEKESFDKSKMMLWATLSGSVSAVAYLTKMLPPVQNYHTDGLHLKYSSRLDLLYSYLDFWELEALTTEGSPYGFFRLSILDLAAAIGSVSLIRYIINNIPINKTKWMGGALYDRNLFHIGLLFGHVEVMKYAIEELGCTPLVSSEGHCNKKVYENLLYFLGLSGYFKVVSYLDEVYSKYDLCLRLEDTKRIRDVILNKNKILSSEDKIILHVLDSIDRKSKIWGEIRNIDPEKVAFPLLCKGGVIGLSIGVIGSALYVAMPSLIPLIHGGITPIIQIIQSFLHSLATIAAFISSIAIATVVNVLIIAVSGVAIGIGCAAIGYLIGRCATAYQVNKAMKKLSDIKPQLGEAIDKPSLSLVPQESKGSPVMESKRRKNEVELKEEKGVVVSLGRARHSP